MKRLIARNIALITALFIVAFTIMLVTNYLNVYGRETLQTQVLENLKKINDENSSNPQLQESIRQLDLMARNAYFITKAHLMDGVYLLIFMVVVFLISTRVYYADIKDIPCKEIDPIDDWAIKTLARKYVRWGGFVVILISLAFIFPNLSFYSTENKINQEELIVNKQEQHEEILTAKVTLEHEVELNNSTDSLVVKNVCVGNQSTGMDNVEEKSIPIQDAIAVVTDGNYNNKAVENKEEIALGVVSNDNKTSPRVGQYAFRGNTGNGTSPAKDIPTKWDLTSGENILWKTDLPLKGFNSPIIVRDKVFITGASDSKRELFCFDLNSGKLLWNLKADNIVGSPEILPKTTPDTGLAASTVATNGQQVCAIFATGDLICADMDGNRLWAKNLGVPDNHYGYASSLLVAGNTLFIQYDNSKNARIIAINTRDGSELWSKSRTDKTSWASPVMMRVNNTNQLIVMGTPHITAYNPSDGQELWKVDCMSGEVGASPCCNEGIVYGASEYSTLIAINGVDGSTLWQASDFLPEVASPVATSSHVYIATSYGVIASYDASDGKLVKEHELGGEFYSSPMIVEGRIYLFETSGKMYVFKADAECSLITSFDTGEYTFATPAFTDGKIVVRTEKSIYCVAGK